MLNRIADAIFGKSRLELYDQAAHVLAFDGVPITGFSEGDWMEIETLQAGSSTSYGAFGPVLNLKKADEGGHLRLHLNANSPAVEFFMLAHAQQLKKPRFFNVALTTGVGELFMFIGCFYGSVGNFSTGGPVMTPRTFVINYTQATLQTL